MENKLPKEIIKKINDDSIEMFPFVGMARTTYERKAYVAGATEWAEWNIAWSKKSQTLEKEHRQLKERCDKMEAALIKIVGMSVGESGPRTAIIEIKNIASAAACFCKEGDKS
jgi:hypothetical protein